MGVIIMDNCCDCGEPLPRIAEATKEWFGFLPFDIWNYNTARGPQIRYLRIDTTGYQPGWAQWDKFGNFSTSAGYSGPPGGANARPYNPTATQLNEVSPFLPQFNRFHTLSAPYTLDDLNTDADAILEAAMPREVGILRRGFIDESGHPLSNPRGPFSGQFYTLDDIKLTQMPPEAAFTLRTNSQGITKRKTKVKIGKYSLTIDAERWPAQDTVPETIPLEPYYHTITCSVGDGHFSEITFPSPSDLLATTLVRVIPNGVCP